MKRRAGRAAPGAVRRQGGLAASPAAADDTGLDNALKTVLAEYRDDFQMRFVAGLSIRKYAAAHQINRGSADHLQKKFSAALARFLKERDEAEEKCRLRRPVQN